MIVEIIILVIGIAILAAGLYYWVKEKIDLESKKNLLNSKYIRSCYYYCCSV
jgi:hypothetical protein